MSRNATIGDAIKLVLNVIDSDDRYDLWGVLIQSTSIDVCIVPAGRPPESSLTKLVSIDINDMTRSNDAIGLMRSLLDRVDETRRQLGEILDGQIAGQHTGSTSLIRLSLPRARRRADG